MRTSRCTYFSPKALETPQLIRASFVTPKYWEGECFHGISNSFVDFSPSKRMGLALSETKGTRSVFICERNPLNFEGNRGSCSRIASRSICQCPSFYRGGGGKVLPICRQVIRSKAFFPSSRAEEAYRLRCHSRMGTVIFRDDGGPFEDGS